MFLTGYSASDNETVWYQDGLMHVWRHGRLEYCSTAEPWTDENGVDLDWGNCLHHDDPDGGPAVVAMRLRPTG